MNASGKCAGPDAVSDADWMTALGRELDGCPLGHPLMTFETVCSTSDILKAAAEEGVPEGTVVIARAQTKGRGTHGRAWMSAAGKGLYLSLLLRPEWPASKSGRLSAVAAVSTVRMLEMLGVKDVRIKYPNDIVTAGRKMGGLLIEPRIGNGRIVFAVLGIGVNLYHDLHDLQQTGLAHIATSCRLQGCEPILTEAAVTLIQTIAMNYQKAAGPAWNSLLQQWINYGGTPELPG